MDMERYLSSRRTPEDGEKRPQKGGRRWNHNEIEKARREQNRRGLEELRCHLPALQRGGNPSANTIISTAIEYIKELKDTIRSGSFVNGKRAMPSFSDPFTATASAASAAPFVMSPTQRSCYFSIPKNPEMMTGNSILEIMEARRRSSLALIDLMDNSVPLPSNRRASRSVTKAMARDAAAAAHAVAPHRDGPSAKALGAYSPGKFSVTSPNASVFYPWEGSSNYTTSPLSSLSSSQGLLLPEGSPAHQSPHNGPAPMTRQAKARGAAESDYELFFSNSIDMRRRQSSLILPTSDPKTLLYSRRDSIQNFFSPMPFIFDDLSKLEINCKQCLGSMNNYVMVDCDECHAWFHIDCVGITTEAIPLRWKCEGCGGEKHARMRSVPPGKMAIPPLAKRTPT